MKVIRSLEKMNSVSANDARRQSQLGFSLLEMIVAMLIFLIVTGSIYGLLQVGRLDRNRSSRRTDMMKNARASIHLIGRDALNAGLSYNKKGASVPDNFLANQFGLVADAGNQRDFLTSIVVGNNIFANDIQEDTNIKTDTVVFAYRDLDFNRPPVAAARPDSPNAPAAPPAVTSGKVIQLSSVAAGDSTDTARVTSSTATGAAKAEKFDLYLIEANNSQVLAMATNMNESNTIDFAPTDPLGINQAYNGAATGRSLLRPCTAEGEEDCTTYNGNFTLKRIFLVAYKVKKDGTLVRVIYGNNTDSPIDQQIREQPLAFNVKDMQIRYVLNNGRVTDDPVLGADEKAGTADDDPNAVNLITQITVTLKVAANENDEQTGKPAVITLNATFSTRNLQYDVG